MELSEEASKIINHPMMSDFFQKAKETYHNTLVASRFDQEDVRADCYFMLRAMEELQSALKYYAMTGKIEKPKVKRLKPLEG